MMPAKEIMKHSKEELNSLYLRALSYSIACRNQRTIEWTHEAKKKFNLSQEDTLEDIVIAMPKCWIARNMGLLSYKSTWTSGYPNRLTFKSLAELSLKLNVLGY